MAHQTVRRMGRRTARCSEMPLAQPLDDSGRRGDNCSSSCSEKQAVAGGRQTCWCSNLQPEVAGGSEGPRVGRTRRPTQPQDGSGRRRDSSSSCSEKQAVAGGRQTSWCSSLQPEAAGGSEGPRVGRTRRPTQPQDGSGRRRDSSSSCSEKQAVAGGRQTCWCSSLQPEAAGGSEGPRVGRTRRPTQPQDGSGRRRDSSSSSPPRRP